MGEVEDAALTVVELSEQMHEPVDNEADVASADDYTHVRRPSERIAKLRDEIFRRREMLDHIQYQDVVVPSEVN